MTRFIDRLKLQNRKRPSRLEAISLPTVVVLGLALSCTVSGCSAGFQNLSSVACATNCGGGGTISSVGPTWEALDMTGSVQGGRFAKSQVLSLNKSQKVVTLHLPIPSTPYLSASNSSRAATFTGISGATWSLLPSANGGNTLTVQLPLLAVLRGAKSAPAAQGLPNGDPLPNLSSNRLPSWTLPLSADGKVQAIVYLDKGVVGIYVNSVFDPLKSLQYGITTSDGLTTWGHLAVVPAKGQSNGGYFLSVQVPADIATLLASHI